MNFKSALVKGGKLIFYLGMLLFLFVPTENLGNPFKKSTTH